MGLDIKVIRVFDMEENTEVYYNVPEGGTYGYDTSERSIRIYNEEQSVIKIILLPQLSLVEVEFLEETPSTYNSEETNERPN